MTGPGRPGGHSVGGVDGSRNLVGWLLLGLVAAVAVGAAVLGVTEAPRQASLRQAVDNTLGASSYTEDISHITPQGTETLHLVFEAPDRIGGYVQLGTARSYVFVVGSTQYQSAAVTPGTPTRGLTLFRQLGTSARSNDPLAAYLADYVRPATVVHRDGTRYRVTVVKRGQTGTFVTTVSGPYVAELSVRAPGLADDIVVSSVDSSPPVRLPAGARVLPASGIP
jgi:hypothetical protein